MKLKLKLFVSAVLLASFAAPAVADQFYIVRDATTKRCTIVDKRPTTTTTTIVGNGVYQTRTEAESSMKKVKVCTEE